MGLIVRFVLVLALQILTLLNRETGSQEIQ